MTQLLIKSESVDSIAPLIKGAIKEQISVLEDGIDRTKVIIEEFEKKHGVKTEEFYEKFKNGDLGDSVDYIEWAGEYELLSKLIRDYEKLKEVEVCT